MQQPRSATLIARSVPNQEKNSWKRWTSEVRMRVVARNLWKVGRDSEKNSRAGSEKNSRAGLRIAPETKSPEVVVCGALGEVALPDGLWEGRILPLLLFLTLTLSGQVQLFDDFGYSSDGAVITIGRYYGPGGAVTIPDAIAGLPGTAEWGATFGGRPTAVWQPQVLTDDVSFGVRENRYGFTITWASDKVVVVEASASLTDPLWSAVSTNTLGTGSSYFSDPQWTSFPSRCYRIRSP